MSEREVKREELTDEERDALENDTGAGERATRSLNSACSAPLSMKRYDIIAKPWDAYSADWDSRESPTGRFVEYEDHAADRAALVAQLEGAETSAALELAKVHAAYKTQVAELAQERDEARDIARKVPGLEFDLKAKTNECEFGDAEVTRLAKALAAAERYKESSVDCMRVLEARVRELESTNAALRNELSRDMQASAESECASLRLQLEAARGVAESECAALRAEVADSEADKVKLYAEARELRAEVERERAEAKKWHARACNSRADFFASEDRLAAANALLERCLDDFAGIVATPVEADRIVVAIRAHLTAQEKKS